MYTVQQVALEVERVGDNYVLDGDILIPVNTIGLHTKSTGRTYGRWLGGVVFYQIAPNLPNTSRVTSAIQHWEQNTSIRFIQRTNQPDYVVFQKGSGCSSNVGRIGGRQVINLADGCDVGATIHEIGHTVGLWHEQSRKNRDNHVNILWNNIESGREHNFQTYGQQGQDGDEYSSFDINSIMMYGPYFFSKNGQPTITLKNGATYNFNRTALSQKDKDGVNAMYSAPYYIWARHSGKVLDVTGVSSANGANIQQWQFNASPNQAWYINHTGNGYFNIISAHSGKALDVAGVSQTNGANIQQWQYTGSANQLWTIENIGTSNPYQKIVSKHSGKALDVAGISSANGANIVQWQYVGGQNQQFWIFNDY